MTQREHKGGAVSLGTLFKGLLKGAHKHIKDNRYLSRGADFLGLDKTAQVLHALGYGKKRRGGAPLSAARPKGARKPRVVKW